MGGERREQDQQTEPKEIDTDRERHSDNALFQWEDLGGISEWHRPHSQGICRGEEISEDCNERLLRPHVGVWDLEASRSDGEKAREERNGNHQEPFPAAFVDQEICWHGKNDVGQANAPAKPERRP